MPDQAPKDRASEYAREQTIAAFYHHSRAASKRPPSEAQLKLDAAFQKRAAEENFLPLDTAPRNKVILIRAATGHVYRARWHRDAWDKNKGAWIEEITGGVVLGPAGWRDRLFWLS